MNIAVPSAFCIYCFMNELIGETPVTSAAPFVSHYQLFVSQCSHVDRRKRDTHRAVTAHDRKLRRKRQKRHLRKLREAAAVPPKPNAGKIVLPDKEDDTKVNKLNSSEVIRLTVVITDKKKKGQKQQELIVREIAAPNFQACTLSFQFWSLMISMTVVVVALTASTVSCALKRRKLKNRRKRKNEKTVKMALNNMKRMQMSSLPWSFYNR